VQEREQGVCQPLFRRQRLISNGRPLSKLLHKMLLHLIPRRGEGAGAGAGTRRASATIP